MQSTDSKREKEKRVVAQMIRLFCKRQHHQADFMSGLPGSFVLCHGSL